MVNETSYYCSEWFSSDAIQGGFFDVTNSSLITSVIEFGVALFILIRLLFNQHRVRNGVDVIAFETLVFPQYIYVLSANVVVLFLVAATTIFVNRPEKSAELVPSLLWAGIWMVFRIFEGVSFFLLERGFGMSEIRRVLRRLAILQCVTFVTFFIRYYFQLVIIEDVYMGLMLAFYAYCLIIAPHCGSPRPALRLWSLFWVFFRSFFLIFRFWNSDTGFCVYYILQCLGLGFGAPLMAYYTLLSDMGYWLGVSKYASEAPVTRPLAGFTVATAAARALSSSLAGFAKRVPFLHFGELHLEERPHLLGQGGTAKVFKGVHKGKDIAIKMVYVMELTPTIIENFMLEARTLAAFNHPNIVSLRGVCVLPPAFLIVLEFMNRGSLDQFLRSLHGLALRWPEKLMMIRDCARAVACLHGMKPEPLLHCDLKSLNFLVSLDELSGHLTVKLSDLELVRGTEGGSQLFNSQSASDLRPLINAQTHEPVPITEEDFGLDRRTFSTFNWTAPELLAGDDYTLHSDVYALAMVAWEVLSPGHVPFEKLAMTDAINTAGALLIQKHTQLVGSHTTYRLSNLSNADANDELSSPNDTSMPLLATHI